MKQLILILLALVSLGFHSEKAKAWEYNDTFQLSCNIVRERWPIIEAYCDDSTGRMVYNRFDRSYCREGVANSFGRLVCVEDYDHGRPPGGGGGLPYGSYQLSCSNCSVYGSTLRCMCKDAAGRYRDTSINYRYCSSTISNQNGHLMCD